MSQEPAIEVEDLHRAYGDIKAVRGVSFSVAPGEVFCLLGPNGAGKTTVTEILEGYRAAGSGKVRVLGKDPASGDPTLRDRVGIVLQETGVQQQLTVAELIEMYGSWYSRRRPTDELISLVGLEGKADAKARELSGGQRRRLDLALALAGDPDVLFLDEPTTGFDPEARRRAWQTVKDLTAGGTTVFLTTHFMDEAQALADRVAVMRAGQIVALGAPDELGGRESAATEIRFRLPDTATLADIPVAPEDTASLDEHERVLIESLDGIAATHSVTGWALREQHELRNFTVTRPTLEDVYLELTATAGQEA